MSPLLVFHALLPSVVLSTWCFLSLFFSSTIVDPFVDFSVANAEPRGDAWDAARAPPVVHLALVLQDSRLLLVEAPALDSPEEGLVVLVLLLVVATFIAILVAGVVQSYNATLAFFRVGTIIELWRQGWRLVVTLNRSDVRNWRSGCEALLGQDRHLLLIFALNRCRAYLLELLALSQNELAERRRWVALVTTRMSMKNLTDTGKPNRFLCRRFLFSLDNLAEVHLASEQEWWKILLLLRVPIFDFWVLHGTHHKLFRLLICVRLGERDSLLFWESQRMLSAFETTIFLVVNKKINQWHSGNALAFLSEEF